MSRKSTPLGRFWAEFRENKVAVVALVVVILMMLLAKAGIINSKQMLGGWRFAVVGIALFAAFVTPPDPISQLMLGSALLLLYFISIGLMRWMEPKTTELDEA